MNIQYKFIEHERTEDAPFVGALISAVGCKLKCKGCFNRDLKKLPTLTKDVKEIIKEIKANPINEGIIFSGLEWSEQPLELLELIREASDNRLKIMIYTGCELSQFHARLGEAMAKKVGMAELDSKEQYDDLMYVYMGSQMLDAYILDDYYIKCGRYDREQISVERVHFGVNLATENQNIIKIERVKE